MEAYAEGRVQQRIEAALERVRVILDATKDPQAAGDVHHQYEDKYLLVEGVTNAAVASQLNSFCALGLTIQQVQTLQEWAKDKAVSFQFISEETCAYDREETREEDDPRRHVEEVSVRGVVQAAFTSKVVTKITEHFWNFAVKYELVAIRGVGETADDRLCLMSRTGQAQLVTSAKQSPRPEVKKPAAKHQVNVSWLFRKLKNDKAVPAFAVDRLAKECKTPRRNEDVQKAYQHCEQLAVFAKQVSSYLRGLFQIQTTAKKSLDLAALRDDDLFIPVLPVMVQSAQEAIEDVEMDGGEALVLVEAVRDEAHSNVQLTVQDSNRLLQEEVRTLKSKQTDLAEAFPADGLATRAEAFAVIALQHVSRVCANWADAVGYVEDMLRKQLAAAIGKEVSPADFAAYMRFHYRKLFHEAFLPKPLCFSVRRSDTHSPEGTLSIEEDVVGPGGDSNIKSPIVTMVASAAESAPMTFPLSASTNITFGGERHLHAWLSHQFSGQSGCQLSLVARARQFSSMLVLIGRVASATSFDPKYAAIIQNKDELTIPLNLSTIPTPKEFKDAIESLSPEQQAFAKAFRAMQLESTLFGVLVVQIKPQLERVLNLSDDSLTKEIKLTQDLMQLFIKYQIPSDLLSFDATAGEAEMVNPTPAERLERVKGHVKAMHEMIEGAKQEEIQAREQEVLYDDPFANQPRAPCGAAGGVAHLQRSSKGGMRGSARSRPMAVPAAMQSIQFSAMPMPGADCAVAECAAAAPPPPAPVPGGAPPPQQQQQQQQAQQQPQQQKVPESSQQFADQAGSTGATSGSRDYTQVPAQMDQRFEKLDTDNSLRPTIISAAERWTKQSQKALLASPSTSFLSKTEQKTEREAAFDLLDALTKSGALPLTHASLHVVIAATHCFDKTVTETVIQNNVNPIAKVERSSLIMASTVHEKPVGELIKDEQVQRVTAASPQLFLEDASS
ncbi:TRPT1 [Symbiodinium natans]|uniref:TRPT1 protein n=1 Tax=Symbiodinium natans TaxID=878477 RepID=A0A812HN73_9DINO|nr:TRPT1 [Symbiodinium natans]